MIESFLSFWCYVYHKRHHHERNGLVLCIKCRRHHVKGAW